MFFQKRIEKNCDFVALLKMSFRLFLGASGVAMAPFLSMFTIFIAPNSIRVLFWIFGGFW